VGTLCETRSFCRPCSWICSCDKVSFSKEEKGDEWKKGNSMVLELCLMELNKIIPGDCIEVMKDFPDNSIDIVIADPPFNTGKNYGETYNDRRPSEEYWAWMKDWIKEVYRILKNDTPFYCFHTDNGIFKLRPIIEKAGFVFRQLLVWHHPNGWGAQLC